MYSDSSKPSSNAALVLRQAWVIWFALGTVPFLLFLVMLWHLMDSDTSGASPAFARAWFLGSMAYLALAVPVAFFWRNRVFKAYWLGQVVAPRDYLKGMLIIWIALETAGLFALLGCLVTTRLLPCLVPALVANVVFIPFWPSGRAMTRPVGNDDDAELYEDPR